MDRRNLRVRPSGGTTEKPEVQLQPKEVMAGMLNPEGRRYLTERDREIMMSGHDDDVVKDVYRAIRQGIIDPRSGAKAIVFRLKTMVATAIRNQPNTQMKDIETLKYLDSILFDSLEYIVESHIKFFLHIGQLYESDDELCTKAVCKDMIANALAYIDYKNIKTGPMNAFIDHIYEIFS